MQTNEAKIDFAAAGLYVPALQAVGATLMASMSVLLTTWVLPASSVRTLAIACACGGGFVAQPIRIGTARGAEAVFQSMRPCVGVYLAALIVEQLAHTCHAATTGAWKRWIFILSMTLMLIAGFVRAYRPRAETDLPFLLCGVALVLAAAFPPPPLESAGPLCAPTLNFYETAVRAIRSFAFALLYVLHVYAATPTANIASEISISIARATSATLWTLCTHPLCLLLAPLQGALALYMRFALTDRHPDVEYGHVPVDEPTVTSPPPDEKSDTLQFSSLQVKPGQKLNLSLSAPAGTGSTLTDAQIAELANKY